MQDQSREAELRRRTLRWSAIAPAWLFFYAFVVLHGLTPLGDAFHGEAVSIAATAKLLSAFIVLDTAPRSTFRKHRLWAWE